MGWLAALATACSTFAEDLGRQVSKHYEHGDNLWYSDERPFDVLLARPTEADRKMSRT